MANKYIRHGATYNGDGTTYALAASNGAAGAWNTNTIMTGTTPAYGALVAGDTVIIRSKDEAGADMTISNASAGANVGSASGTATAPITWILDNGTVWAGINGTLTYSTTSQFNVRVNNVFKSAQDKLIWLLNTASPSTYNSFFNILGVLENSKLDLSAKTNTAAVGIAVSGGALVNPTIKAGRLGLATNFLFYASASSIFSLINPDIELTYNPGTNGEGVIFNRASTGMLLLRVTGGRLYGVGAKTGCSLLGGPVDGFDAQFIGFEFPKTMGLTAVFDKPWSIYGLGSDGGAGGFLQEYWGLADSRDDGNYPVLDATLPTSTGTDKWSWKLYPANTSPFNPSSTMKMSFGKFFTGAAATKTLTAYLLISDTLSYSKETLWIDVIYTDDTTGEQKYISSKTTGELDTSTAGWSATTYGAINFVKKQVSITTPTTVKQDTLVSVILRGTVKSVTSDDILFVDPDVGIA